MFSNLCGGNDINTRKNVLILTCPSMSIFSKSPKDGYQENISGKYIQTVYSTSDRSVIERDMCTYCRKPLGVETKMILDELQICCHSTCFKCEICKQPLENLQAGDSIWIYRQTIHCEPCYSKVMAKWIQ